MKNQKGITLVALVITIIVLLILAGVSISMISGDDGIINRASSASEKTNAATEEEVEQLGETKNYIDEKVNASANGGNPAGNVGVEKPEYIVGEGFEVNYNELDQLLSITGCYYVQIKADIAETINFYVKLTSEPDTAYQPTNVRQPYNLISGGHSYPGVVIGTSIAGSYSAWDTLAIEVPDKTNDYTVKVEYVYSDGTVEYATSTKPIVE